MHTVELRIDRLAPRERMFAVIERAGRGVVKVEHYGDLPTARRTAQSWADTYGARFSHDDTDLG